jgi:glutamate-1-semialdehyde aminotransferase
MGPTGWAGLIVEPPLEALDPANVSFLKFLQGFCRENSILFVLDEVVTSLRFGMAGIAGRLGLEPDLICVGKGLGNGLPIAALVGRKKYMEKFRGDSPVFCSSTNWGEALSLASARCVLTRWGLPEVAHIWKLGERLMDGLVKAGWFVRGHPPRSLVAFRSQEERAFFICGMRDRGILMNRPNFPNLAHSAWDVDATVKVAEDLRKELDSIPEDQLKRDWSARVPRALFQAR